MQTESKQNILLNPKSLTHLLCLFVWSVWWIIICPKPAFLFQKQIKMNSDEEFVILKQAAATVFGSSIFKYDVT